MSQPPYPVLKVALRIFSALLVIGALFMIFASRALVVWIFLHPPEAEVSTLLLFLLKEMGGMVLMISAMLYLASRDPEHNVAIVDGLIVGLVVLAVFVGWHGDLVQITVQSAVASFASTVPGRPISD